MTNDDLLLMAWKAGLAVIKEPNHWEFGGDTSELAVFADLIAAHEREQCAQLMDDMAARDKLTNYYKVAARAIRERKE